MALRSNPLRIQLPDTDAASFRRYVGTRHLHRGDLVEPTLSIHLAIKGPGVLLALVIDVAGQPATPLVGARCGTAVGSAPAVLDTRAPVTSLHSLLLRYRECATEQRQLLTRSEFHQFLVEVGSGGGLVGLCDVTVGSIPAS